MSTLKKSTKKPASKKILPIELRILDRFNSINKGKLAEYYNDVSVDCGGYIAVADNVSEDFSFDTREFPFCCGWYEIGDFSWQNGDLLRDSERTELLAKAIDIAITEAGYRTTGRKKMFITTIAPRDEESIIFERAVIKTGKFKLIATFDNSGGSRGLKTYITK